MNKNLRVPSVKPGQKNTFCWDSEPGKGNDLVKSRFNRLPKLSSPSGLKSIISTICDINTESLIDRKRGKSKSFNCSPFGLNQMELKIKLEEVDDGFGNCLEQKMSTDKCELSNSKNIKMMVNGDREMCCKNKNNDFLRVRKKTSSIDEFQLFSIQKSKDFSNTSPKVMGITKRGERNIIKNEKTEVHFENPITLRIPLKTTERKNSLLKLEKSEPTLKTRHYQKKKNTSNINQEHSLEKKLKNKLELKKRQNFKPLKSFQRLKSLKKGKNKKLAKDIENCSKKVRFDDKSNNYHNCVLYKAENEKSRSSCFSFESSIRENWIDIMMWDQSDKGPSEFVQEFEWNLLNNNKDSLN